MHTERSCFDFHPHVPYSPGTVSHGIVVTRVGTSHLLVRIFRTEGVLQSGDLFLSPVNMHAHAALRRVYAAPPTHVVVPKHAQQHRPQRFRERHHFLVFGIHLEIGIFPMRNDVCPTTTKHSYNFPTCCPRWGGIPSPVGSANLQAIRTASIKTVCRPGHQEKIPRL